MSCFIAYPEARIKWYPYTGAVFNREITSVRLLAALEQFYAMVTGSASSRNGKLTKHAKFLLRRHDSLNVHYSTGKKIATAAPRVQWYRSWRACKATEEVDFLVTVDLESQKSTISNTHG
ncbi:uncharacterized protein EV420DRAFT_1747180 [Desarmillaria tabescens]|uniref:Uncharacterized protein n=1 Tax=Armillaria tabescens TaxID=1929756 RepID=A0AA39N7B9_ARMTA|nr:uncharacterized protein EV420DRAFT_1747180 [Desarmillaria tabescens]KAK0460263.1 hypothetical protein EV420DRAFT_1747180 [Desarmillaria tabescens]